MVSLYLTRMHTTLAAHIAWSNLGKLCGAFLVDQAFEDYMRTDSGLNFKKCEDTKFRGFVHNEWEVTMKRTFSGSEQQENFLVRPPARTFSTVKKLKGVNDSFHIPKYAQSCSRLEPVTR